MLKMPTPVFCRYSELTPSAVNVEYQVHTNWTDGQASSAAILEEAARIGLGAIAFTEHVRRSTDWFDSFAAEIREIAHAYPAMKVFVGSEAKALDEAGTLDISPSVQQGSDIVLGVVHRFPDGNGDYLDFNKISAAETAAIEFQLSMGLIKHAPIDVLGHPGGMYQRRHGAFPAEYFAQMMEASLERGIAIEINSSYLVDTATFVELCRQIDPIVSIGSDAHRIDQLGQCRDILRTMGVGR
ncbi:PHP domain-containing protein (plasmid) [Rhizobium sullae]|uniref:Histidinol-phosphatase n=2 Tax=Rhizobium sullae TaxID=50338 RepID=A0A2N0D7N1_RHISU|nr:PHP domain-containing protein [Rhizobium sullae]PKA42097.1 histidinol-phosphatase [Rhizobium sullae]UWU18396.1 PHP domain-containing protein [Rhizobium sullae]